MSLDASSGLVNEMAKIGGKSFADTMVNSYIKIFTLPRPTDSDYVETGTLLGIMTVDGDTFAPGSAANGLNFAAALDDVGKVTKAVAEDWEFTALATGEAGWFRHYSNAVSMEGDDTTDDAVDREKIRYDGDIGTGTTADMKTTSTSVTLGNKAAVNTFKISIPRKA